MATERMVIKLMGSEDWLEFAAKYHDCSKAAYIRDLLRRDQDGASAAMLERFEAYREALTKDRSNA